MTSPSSIQGKQVNAVLCDPAVLANLLHMDHAYKFMKPVQGTPAFWQTRLFDTVCDGISWENEPGSSTQSAAEFLWIEFIQAIGARRKKIYTQVQQMTIAIQPTNQEWE